MSGWVAALALALLVVAGLWRTFGRDLGALQFLGAALLLGLAGYAWQGRPELTGSPKSASAEAREPDTTFARLRPELLPRFSAESNWLTIAETYQREGDTQAAVQIIESALRRAPNNADLRTGLAVALVRHADSLLTPAAELAFRRAAAAAPDYPAPHFFYAVALLESGDLDRAEAVWRRLLASTAPASTWRTATGRQLALTAEIRRRLAERSPPAR